MESAECKSALQAECKSSQHVNMVSQLVKRTLESALQAESKFAECTSCDEEPRKKSKVSKEDSNSSLPEELKQLVTQELFKLNPKIPLCLPTALRNLARSSSNFDSFAKSWMRSAFTLHSGYLLVADPFFSRDQLHPIHHAGFFIMARKGNFIGAKRSVPCLLFVLIAIGIWNVFYERNVEDKICKIYACHQVTTMQERHLN